MTPGADRLPSPAAADDIQDAEIVPDDAPAGLTAAGSMASVPGPGTDISGYTDAGVPTLDYLRDRIERRMGTAQGSAELAEAAAARSAAARAADSARADVEAAAARAAAQDRAARQEELARERLEEIRRGLH